MNSNGGNRADTVAHALDEALADALLAERGFADARTAPVEPLATGPKAHAPRRE